MTPKCTRIPDGAALDPLDHLAHRLEGLLDVGLHRLGRVEHEHDAGVGLAQHLLRRLLLRRVLLPQRDGRDPHHEELLVAHRVVVLDELEDREDVEGLGVVDVHVLRGLDGDDPGPLRRAARLRLLAPARREGDEGLVVQQPLEGLEVTKEELALASRRVGEGGDDVVPPGNDVRLAHPSLGGQADRPPDLEPAALLCEDVEGLEGGVGAGLGAVPGVPAGHVRPGQDALVHRALARDEEGPAFLRFGRPGRQRGDQRPDGEEREGLEWNSVLHGGHLAGQ